AGEPDDALGPGRLGDLLDLPALGGLPGPDLAAGAAGGAIDEEPAWTAVAVADLEPLPDDVGDVVRGDEAVAQVQPAHRLGRAARIERLKGGEERRERLLGAGPFRVLLPATGLDGHVPHPELRAERLEGFRRGLLGAAAQTHERIGDAVAVHPGPGVRLFGV